MVAKLKPETKLTLLAGAGIVFYLACISIVPCIYEATVLSGKRLNAYEIQQVLAELRTAITQGFGGIAIVFTLVAALRRAFAAEQTGVDPVSWTIFHLTNRDHHATQPTTLSK